MLSLKIGRMQSMRRIAVFIAAIGLLLQSYVTQTHIHFSGPESGAVSHPVKHATGKAPLNKVAECPLCQAIVQAGAFVTPAVPLISLSLNWIGTVSPAHVARPALITIAHDWRSRAPPRI